MKIWDGITPWRRKLNWDAPPQGEDIDKLIAEIIRTQQATDALESLSGLVATGTSKTLASQFTSLPAAQAVYPHATALSDELDWAILQDALTKSRYVEVPVGTYRVNRSLDAANKPGQVFKAHGRGTVIDSTGPVILDLSGSPGNQVSNIELKGGPLSKCGVLLARSDAQPYSEHCSIKDIKVTMQHVPTLNGDKGTVAIYNNAAEIFYSDNIYALADTPLVDTASNYYAINSEFAARTTPFTSNGLKSYRSLSLTAYGGPAVLLEASFGALFDQCFLTSWSPEVGGPNTYAYAFHLRGHPKNTRILSNHIENFKRVAYIYLSNLKGFQLSSSFYSDGQPPLHLFGFNPNKGGIESGSICLQNLNATTHDLFGLEQFTNEVDYEGLKNLDIFLQPSTSFPNSIMPAEKSVTVRSNISEISADRGDTNITLVATDDSPTQIFATTLTANRTVTISTNKAYGGAKFKVVRRGLGAFTLAVGGLKTIPSATAAWVEATFNGTAWELTGYGTL